MGSDFMKKRIYLIPLLLVVLGLLVPLVHAAIRNDRGSEPPSGAFVQRSDVEANARDGIKNSLYNNQNETDDETDQEQGSSGEKDERRESTEKTAPNNVSQSQTERSDSSTKQTDTKQQTDASQSETPGTEQEPQKGIKVGLAVVGMDKKPIKKYDVVIPENSSWGNTALGALDASGVDYVMSTRFSGFVESICGQKNKGLSGWMYAVNGEYKSVAADKCSVKNGDRIIWYYSESIDSPAPDWNHL